MSARVKGQDAIGSGGIPLAVQGERAAAENWPKAIAERHRSRREALAGLSGNISPQIYKGAAGSTGERDWISVLIGSQNRNRQRTR